MRKKNLNGTALPVLALERARAHACILTHTYTHTHSVYKFLKVKPE